MGNTVQPGDRTMGDGETIIALLRDILAELQRQREIASVYRIEERRWRAEDIEEEDRLNKETDEMLRKAEFKR
jgi:hypothetical protein